MNKLLIDSMVTLEEVSCERRRNLSITWVDVKKAHDSVDHGWLGERVALHRFPNWLCDVICKLCKSWNTRIVANTLDERDISEEIVF